MKFTLQPNEGQTLQIAGGSFLRCVGSTGKFNVEVTLAGSSAKQRFTMENGMAYNAPPGTVYESVRITDVTGAPNTIEIEHGAGTLYDDRLTVANVITVVPDGGEMSVDASGHTLTVDASGATVPVTQADEFQPKEAVATDLNDGSNTVAAGTQATLFSPDPTRRALWVTNTGTVTLFLRKALGVFARGVAVAPGDTVRLENNGLVRVTNPSAVDGSCIWATEHWA